MLRLAMSALLLWNALPIVALGQEHAVTRKTIEISATEKVVVPADMATIKIGYQNLAATKDAAYTENTRAANKILEAILEAGVPKDKIETESLRLEQEREVYGPRSDQPLKYSADQQWRIHSKASEAQKIVDIAVVAGANRIENVDWSVNDPDQLEARAYGAALKRARNLAEQTASQTGLKLGEIVFIANSINSPDRELLVRGGNTLFEVAAPKMAMLKLQPGTVEREASVTVTFAVAP